MPTEVKAGSAPEALQVPFSRIATFIRQVTHDVRNDLNSLDLQAAYATELIADPEAAAEMKRLRSIIQTSARHLQALSSNFQSSAPNLVQYQASILVEDLRERVEKTFPEQAADLQWEVALGQQVLEVDVEMFFGALMELFRNAFQFRVEGQPIVVHVAEAEGNFVWEIREHKPEPATPPEGWGSEPFVSTRRSGYGLGLFKVRKALAAHQGELKFSYDSGSALLRTRVVLRFAPQP